MLAVSFLPSDYTLWHLALLTVISFGAGVLGGFVGLALGTVRLPAILLILPCMPATVAGGTNILVSTLSAITGSYGHLRERRVDMGAVIVMGVPAIIGAFAGGFFAGAAPEALLVGLAGVFVVWQGIELVRRARAQATASGLGQDAPQERLSFNVRRDAQAAGIGLVVGLVGGAVGLILGTVRLPALIRVLKMDPRRAAGTNMVTGALMGSFGFVGHGVRGDVDLPLLLAMGIAAMIGSYLGSRLTGKVSLNSLIFVMGVVLVVSGTLLLWNAATSLRF